MMLGSRNGFAVNGWRNPYVTDGLVAMWDGEWNAGPGQHDPNATVWKDLVGNTDITLVGTDITDTCIKFYHSDDYSSYGSANFPTGFGAIEVCINKKNIFNFNGTYADTCIITIGDQYSGWGIVESTATGTSELNIGSTKDHTNDSALNSKFGIFHGMPMTIAFNKNLDGTNSAAAYNGVLFNYERQFTNLFNGGKNSINAAPGSNRPSCSSDIDYYCMRIYNRPLTASEIAHNYAIDKARFNLP